MPIETATYLSELNPALPAATDGLQQADDHMRLTKGVVQNTFPNFTAAALDATQAELDAAVASHQDGTGLHAKGTVALPGMGFQTPDTDPADPQVPTGTGWSSNPNLTTNTDTLKGSVMGTEFVAVSKDSGGAVSVAFAKDVSATKLTGPGAVPIGGTLIWWSDTLPDSTSFGTYSWCNGATYLRSNTALFDILGTKYGVGNGTTTANLPDLRDNVPVGKGTMGATTAVGRIVTGVTGFTSSVLGAMFGAALHVITKAQLPNITIPFDWRHTHNLVADNEASAALTATNQIASNSHYGSDSFANANLAGTGVAATLAETSSEGDSAGIDLGGSGTSHNNTQPSIVCNWIIRTA